LPGRGDLGIDFSAKTDSAQHGYSRKAHAESRAARSGCVKVSESVKNDEAHMVMSGNVFEPSTDPEISAFSVP